MKAYFFTFNLTKFANDCLFFLLLYGNLTSDLHLMENVGSLLQTFMPRVCLARTLW